MRKRAAKSEAILALLDTLQELHLECLTIFHEYGALSHACFARGSPAISVLMGASLLAVYELLYHALHIWSVYASV